MYGRGAESGDDWSRGRGYRSRGRGLGYRGDGPPESKYRKTYNVSDEAEEQVRELFQKKFQFTNEYPQQWKLPDPNQIFQDPQYGFHQLLDIKKRLNATKSQLDEKEIISWQRHTKFSNRAATIIPAIRKQFNTELCTQGWTKLHEMLTVFNIVPDSMIRLNSLHLCEAPGAFITSLNHYIKTHRIDVIWNWKAMTLNPYYEGNDLVALIDQDRFMMETSVNWYFGRDNSGDIMTWDNVMGLMEVVKKDLKEVNLVTADGSIDCANNPAEQENLVAQLLFCETFTALLVLREGGTYIMKSFTTLECQTACLMYLLSVCFKEVNVFKPVTSKAGNSEQYVICVNYKGKSTFSDAHWDRMRLGFNTIYSNRVLFPMMTIPESFLSQLVNCASKFAKYQMDAIEENLRLYICMKFSERKHIQEVKDHCCKEFINRCKLKSLPREKAVLPRIHLDGFHGLHSVQPSNSDTSTVLERRTTGSLVSRLEKLQRPWSDTVRGQQDTLLGDGELSKAGPSDATKHVLQHLGRAGGTTHEDRSSDIDNSQKDGQIINAMGIDIQPEDVNWLRGRYAQKTIDKHDFNTLDGKRVEKVTNTRFCRNEALKKLVDTIDKAQVIQPHNISDFAHIVSKCLPCHALLASNPPFFLNSEGLNMAAVDVLTGVISQIPLSEDQPLTFVDLWGAPSNYGQYVYWTRSNCNIKGWGVVRSERPSLRPSPALARLVQWDSFQILGSVQGLDITNNDTINSIVAAVDSEYSGGVHLVFGDLSSLPFGAHAPGYEEYSTKQQLLSQCICALKLLAHGGSFVCRVYSTLTRFSVGLIYLIYRLFQEIALVKPVTSSPASPEQFLVCKGYNECPPIISELLLVVNSHISDLKQHQGYGGGRGNIAPTDVLEIFPVHLLFEDAFYQYMTLNNERMAKLQTQTILQLEKYLLEPEILPGDETQEKLRKGILELLSLPEFLS